MLLLDYWTKVNGAYLFSIIEYIQKLKERVNYEDNLKYGNYLDYIALVNWDLYQEQQQRKVA